MGAKNDKGSPLADRLGTVSIGYMLTALFYYPREVSHEKNRNKCKNPDIARQPSNRSLSFALP